MFPPDRLSSRTPDSGCSTAPPIGRAEYIAVCLPPSRLRLSTATPEIRSRRFATIRGARYLVAEIAITPLLTGRKCERNRRYAHEH